MVQHNQMPEWQQKSLSRLPDLYTADPVPNSEKLEGKWRSLRGIKLVPFVERTGERNASTRCHLGVSDLRTLTISACTRRSIPPKLGLG